jgi:tetratricopeptide (TPR) repeat protein
VISHGEDDGSREAGGAGREAPAPAVARTEGATDASRERVPGLPTLGSTPRHGRAAHAGGDSAEGIGSVIDERYVITDLLSAGRTGAVYLARQTRPVPRTVAIKVIPESRGASGVIIRYERERARLDRLEHPGIARMLEVGLTTSGSGCFVMEYARGSPIVKYCDQRRLAPGERLGLVAQVCRAVEFAHQKGVIHGGLWPSNVMVCDAEGPPLAKVLDFGLARATEPDGGESHPFDRRPASHLVPEQVGPLAADIDTRADVYALGAMLYELLSGSTPLDSGSVSGREGIEAAFREDPPTPSLRLRRSRAGEDIARARGGTVSRLSRWMSGDLDAIVMKALSRDRGRRYATVGEFRADIERFVAGEPVGARPVGAGSRAVKFARRNRVAAAVTGLALAGLMAGVIGMARGWIETKGRRETAERARWSAAVSAREMGLRRESSRRHEAEATNRRSHEALEVFTEEVMGRIPAGRRERTPEEVSVLRGVSAQWELIAESRGEAAEARSRRARALDELSRIRDRQGRPEESLALAREALALWTALADEYPRESEYRRRQGEGQRGIAGRTRARGDLAESERESMLAVSVFRGLGDDEPGDRRLLAASLADLAAVCRDRAHWAEAERASREGAAILDGLIEADPEEGNVGLREEAADSHRDLGLSLRRLGQGEAAESEYRLALAIWDRVASSSPDDAAKTRRRAAGIGRELGVLLIELGRADEAEGVLAGAVEELRRLVASNPSRTASLSELARCRRDQARALGALGRSVEAEGAVREAIAIGEGLVARRPEPRPLRDDGAERIEPGRGPGAARERHRDPERRMRNGAGFRAGSGGAAEGPRREGGGAGGSGSDGGGGGGLGPGDRAGDGPGDGAVPVAARDGEGGAGRSRPGDR